MRVALVTNLPVDLDAPRGGVQSTAVAMTRALAERTDVKLHVVVVNADVPGDEDRALGRARLHYRTAQRRPVILGALTDQRRIVTGILTELRPDIVHACDTSYFKVGYRASPVIYHVQGSIHADTLLDGWARRLRSGLWGYLERRGLRGADALLLNNPRFAESIRALRADDVYVVDEPVAAEMFAVEHAPRRQRVLCVGAVCELKNSLALVDAAAKLRERGVRIEVRFAGGIDEAFAPRLREHVRATDADSLCEFLGYLSRGELLEELASAAVLAHPSLREHAPAAISEALVVGLPVVASHVGGIPFMIDEGQTGFLIDPRDSDQLADRLERLLVDDELRGRMSAAARSAGRVRFSGPAVAERLCEVYRRIGVSEEAAVTR